MSFMEKTQTTLDMCSLFDQCVARYCSSVALSFMCLLALCLLENRSCWFYFSLWLPFSILFKKTFPMPKALRYFSITSCSFIALPFILHLQSTVFFCVDIQFITLFPATLFLGSQIKHLYKRGFVWNLFSCIWSVYPCVNTSNYVNCCNSLE